MFVPLSHPPGQAQCDFGEALVVIGGVQRKAHCFVPDLPHSDGWFIKAHPAESTEAFLDGHVSSFSFLGGIPREGEVGVGVDVDETRGNDLSRGIELPLCLQASTVSHGCDASVSDGNIRLPRRRPVAVNHLSTTDQYVFHPLLLETVSDGQGVQSQWRVGQ